MITEKQAIALLKELTRTNFEADYNSFYKNMEWFLSYTKHLIEIDKQEEVKLCFSLADKLWTEGDFTVKNAVENVFVYSLGTLLDLQRSQHIKEIFKESLHTIYLKQVMASGI